ncbi:MAG: ureidoglycolate lyase [Pseudomonadota bacterium]
MIELTPELLSAERFSAYGDVIEASAAQRTGMNAARFDRFDNLARVETDADGSPTIGLVRCRIVTTLPYQFDMVERHPYGSQAFIPLQQSPFVLVVAGPGESVEAEDLRAFVTNGRQGINYHRGTWHMPLIGLEADQEFIVVDRGGPSPNCDEHQLEEPVMLLAT